MLLTAGTQIGFYEVVAPLGSGGMGEVYRARDTKLDREVAIKVLPEAFVSDPDRTARFAREAKTLAALNHPNIAAIYGIEESHGVSALVLELVEGPTLADRIAQGPIPLDEALPITKQIAEALEAAHEQGIIHRDLKPANIKLRPDGTVKVLDFGLAKAIAGEGPSPTSITLANSPTITSPVGVTGVGVLLGTAAYMSPEQARGKAVDKRADIWAFGCVLYEMLTGKRCFDGEDASLTLAAVMKTEPEWRALPIATPPAVRATLTQCLQKDPKRRVRDIGDVCLGFEGAFALETASLHDRASHRRSAWTRVAVGAIGVVVLGTIGVMAMWGRTPERSVAPHINRFIISLPPGTAFRESVAEPLAITADGRRIVLNAASNNVDRVLVRPLDQIQFFPIQGLEGEVGSLSLSPDGEWVAFNDPRDSRFKRGRLTGGSAASIAETGVIEGGFGGATWGTGGTIVFATAAARALMQVAESGGAPRPLTTPADDETHRHPHFLPDGRSLLFVIRKESNPPQIALLPGGGTPVILFTGTQPRYASTGHIVFVRDGAVWAAAFDVFTGQVTRDPSPVLESVSISTGGSARMSFSADGTLVYLPGSSGATRSVVRVERNGREQTLPGMPAGNYEAIRISPDGQKLAFDAGQPGDVWTYDFTRGTTSKVTTDTAADRYPIWNADSQRLAFMSNRNGRPEIFWQEADGSGVAELLVSSDRKDTVRLQPESWADGDKTLVVSEGAGGQTRIGAVSLTADSGIASITNSPAREGAATLSPNGRWIAYQSDVSGRFEVYVGRFPSLGDRQSISVGGGFAPRWSKTGRELFYLTPDGRRVVAVPIAESDGKLTVGVSATLFEGRYVPNVAGGRPFDVMPDGQSFLLIKSASTGDTNTLDTIIVVENWHEELKRLVPIR